jgi:hypothetical protein
VVARRPNLNVRFTPKSGHSHRRSGISLAIKFRVADMRGLHAGTRQPLAELIRKPIGTEIGEPVRSGGNIMVLKIGASAIALLLMSSIAIAQQQSNAVRVRGTIESKDHQTLNVKARSGETLKVKLADNAPVRAVVKAPLSDVRTGSFVGVTAMPQPDGTQKALEVHIFPEAMRGTGEGHRPWDLMPNSTMTNATVASEVVSSNGKTLVLKYKDGEKTFEVSPDVPVVTFAPATEVDLKPGEKVFSAAANKLPDGTIVASNIPVGRNGIGPPM